MRQLRVLADGEVVSLFDGAGQVLGVEAQVGVDAAGSALLPAGQEKVREVEAGAPRQRAVRQRHALERLAAPEEGQRVVHAHAAGVKRGLQLDRSGVDEGGRRDGGFKRLVAVALFFEVNSPRVDARAGGAYAAAVRG